MHIKEVFLVKGIHFTGDPTSLTRSTSVLPTESDHRIALPRIHNREKCLIRCPITYPSPGPPIIGPWDPDQKNASSMVRYAYCHTPDSLLARGPATLST